MVTLQYFWSSSQSTLPFFLTSSLAVGSGVLLHLPKISFCCEKSFVYIDFCSLGFLAYANEEFFLLLWKAPFFVFHLWQLQGKSKFDLFFSNSGQDFPVIRRSKIWSKSVRENLSLKLGGKQFKQTLNLTLPHLGNLWQVTCERLFENCTSVKEILTEKYCLYHHVRKSCRKNSLRYK